MVVRLIPVTLLMDVVFVGNKRVFEVLKWGNCAIMLTEGGFLLRSLII